jgi:hypothetical protein
VSDGGPRPESDPPRKGERSGRGLPSPGLDADQSCFGCLILVGLIVLSLAVWGFVYWRANPEFHTP